MAEYPRPFLWKRMDQESGYGRIPKTVFVETVPTKHNFGGMDDNLICNSL